jgi:hypothetical protein
MEEKLRSDGKLRKKKYATTDDLREERGYC